MFFFSSFSFSFLVRPGEYLEVVDKWQTRYLYKRAVGRTTPKCGFRNRTAKPNVATCLPLTSGRTRTLVWGIYGYRQSLSGVARNGLRRCEGFRNNLERISWGTWWNIKAYQAPVQKIPRCSQSLQQQTPLGCVCCWKLRMCHRGTRKILIKEEVKRKKGKKVH